jgi:hypothetical protein
VAGRNRDGDANVLLDDLGASGELDASDHHVVRRVQADGQISGLKHVVSPEGSEASSEPKVFKPQYSTPPAPGWGLESRQAKKQRAANAARMEFAMKLIFKTHKWAQG